MGSLQAELFQARIAINQASTELSRARDDSRTTADDPDKTIANTADLLTSLDSIISRIHQRLAHQPPRKQTRQRPPTRDRGDRLSRDADRVEAPVVCAPGPVGDLGLVGGVPGRPDDGEGRGSPDR
jgi:hypothetical protein